MMNKKRLASVSAEELLGDQSLQEELLPAGGWAWAVAPSSTVRLRRRRQRRRRGGYLLGDCWAAGSLLSCWVTDPGWVRLFLCAHPSPDHRLPLPSKDGGGGHRYCESGRRSALSCWNSTCNRNRSSNHKKMTEPIEGYFWEQEHGVLKTETCQDLRAFSTF